MPNMRFLIYPTNTKLKVKYLYQHFHYYYKAVDTVIFSPYPHNTIAQLQIEVNPF